MTSGGSDEEDPTWEPVHLWIDADPSGLVWTGLDCDDDLAILAAMALNTTGEVRLEGVSIVGGNAPLKHTSADAELLLRGVVGTDVLAPLGAGWRSQQFPYGALRALTQSVELELPSSDDAAKTIIEVAARLPPRSLVVLTLGPVTNLARALELEPSLGAQLRMAVLMGGQLTGRQLDLNFGTDRAAARAVVDAPDLPVVMLPEQTCAQVAMTRDEVDRFSAECCPSAAACAVAPKMRQQTWLMPWLVNPRVRQKFPVDGALRPSRGLDDGFVPWDLIALLGVARPSHFGSWRRLAVRMPGCSGGEPCDSRMEVQAIADEAGLPTREQIESAPAGAWAGTVLAPYEVLSEALVLAEARGLLCVVPMRGGGAPLALLPGFLVPVAMLTATLVTFCGALVAGACLDGKSRRAARRRFCFLKRSESGSQWHASAQR